MHIDSDATVSNENLLDQPNQSTEQHEDSDKREDDDWTILDHK